MLGLGAMVALLLDKPMDSSGSNDAEDGVGGDAAVTGVGGTGEAGVAFMKPNADPGAVDSATLPEGCIFYIGKVSVIHARQLCVKNMASVQYLPQQGRSTLPFQLWHLYS